MPRFVYKAKRGPAEVIHGALEAENFDSAVDKITQLGLIPVDIVLDRHRPEKLGIQNIQKKKSFSFSFFHSVKSSDVELFIRQMADLIDAGVPLLKALRVASSHTRHPRLKEIILKMEKTVEDGGALSAALAQYPSVFSGFFSHMVKSGEISGRLGNVLKRLAEFVEKEEEARAKIKASLVYPALVLAVGCVTIFILLTFVIPRLTVMFDDLSQELPLPTVILIVLSNFFSRFWWLFFAALGLALFYFKKFLNSLEGKLRFDAFTLRMPVVGNFIINIQMSRFTRTLATLLNSGVSIVTALESAGEVMDNEVFKKEIKKAAQDVAGGTNLQAALKKSLFFPDIAVNMIAVGEESGHLEESLAKLADSYEKQSDRDMKAATSLLEPLMIIFIGCVVGFIVMAMLLPIFKMNLIIQ